MSSGNMISVENDSVSRNRIVSEIDRNFFVEAGAGSGKTSMLVRRMVAMVEAGKPISKISAITFTKAAAGEFYDRFQKLLIERSNPNAEWKDMGWAGQLPKPTEETRRRCVDALQDIDLCFMGTIDAFCFSVLSEHPYEAGIPSDAKIISDPDEETVFRQEYVKISRGDHEQELYELAKKFRVLHRNAEEVFVAGMDFVMKNRNVSFHFTKNDGIDIDREFAGDRQELVKALKCLVDHPEVKYDKEIKSAEAWEEISAIYNAVRGRWSNNFPNLVYQLKTLKKLRVKTEALDRYRVLLGPALVEGGKSGKWLEFRAVQDGALYDRLLKLRYDISMTFLTACVPVIETAMRDKGYLSYFDCLYYLRNMLKNDAEKDGKLIRYIYDRHSYFLIDEFQDTNPMQAEVFFYLTSEHPVPQWSACVPRQGSLFIVGDPKQSIYRFRSADVSSFLKVKHLFEESGGAILALSKNFRSTRSLCEHFNQMFSEMLPEETENQSRYETIPFEDPEKDNAVPPVKEGEFQGVYTYGAFTGKGAEENPMESDPVRISEIITRLVDRDEYLIRGEKDKAPRKIRYSDFMVITYGKSKLGPIMARLDELGIPVRVEGSVPFEDNEALREIVRIYSAVADPENRIALYGALTGKLLSLTNSQVLKYRQAGGEVSLNAYFNPEDLTDPDVALVAEKLEILRALRRETPKLSPAGLFTRIMDGFRVYQNVKTDNLEVVCYALELLRNAESSAAVATLKDGAKFLSQLADGESEEERCLSLNDSKNCVHMANLHKVKGLEAPIVILAAASSRSSSADYRILHGDSGSDGYLFALKDAKTVNGIKRTFFDTGEFADEKAKENEALKAEAQRLVYVGATRARNALILCDRNTIYRGKPIHDSKWKEIMPDGLPNIFEAVTAREDAGIAPAETANAADLYALAEESSVLNDRSAETASYREETPSGLELVSKLAENPAESKVTSPETAAGEPSGPAETGFDVHDLPTILGTMTHKLMEMLVSSRNRIDGREAVKEILSEFRTPESERYEGKLEAALNTVAERMRNGGYEQTNGLRADILNVLLNADEVYCEVPFCYKEASDNGSVIWNGIMDVVYVTGGKWHILDYKTNANGNDLDRKYQAQMAAYVKALKVTAGAVADAHTYHIYI